jgi:D-alanine-D-alanine ligase
MSDKPNVIVFYNYYKSWEADERAQADRMTDELVDELKRVGHTVKVAEFWKDPRPVLRKYDPDEWIIFQWVEGIEDEVGGDARVCAELDALGFTYTGNPPDTLRLSVEKGRVKKALNRWNIPTPAGGEFERGEQVPANWDVFPCIIKPVSQHCSAGVNRDAVVHDLAALRARIEHVREVYKESSLVEAFIAGREINVGIWGNGRPQLLPLREIDFSAFSNPYHQMVTWDSKWVPTSEDYNKQPVLFDVKATEALRARLEEISLKTWRAFGCRDYARVDFRIDSHDQPFVIDVNPNPDITSDGGFIGGCRMLGFGYGEAVSHIIDMAGKRRKRRKALAATLRARKQTAAPRTRKPAALAVA